MNSSQDKQKKKDLGIFYTPPEVVDFIFSILNILKQKEDEEKQRWQNHKPRPHYPSVIDPAVGEGVFLKGAIESGLTKTDYIFGLDIDSSVVKKWKEINLLKEFGGQEEDLEAHFFHQDGLDRIHWEQHIQKYRYKLKQKDIKAQQFDVVVGNPPYGGIGVDFKRKKTKEAVRLLKVLENFEIFGFRKFKPPKEDVSIDSSGRRHYKITLFDQISISDNIKVRKNKSPYKVSINEVANIAQGMPIEVLFIERFIQLAKPGGWIAIIIPDGILANSQLHYVREFIAKKTRVLAIVSLPRDTFKKVGTGAKTSILFLQKYRESDKINMDYPVFLASIKKLKKEYFKEISNSFKNFYYEQF